MFDVTEVETCAYSDVRIVFTNRYTRWVLESNQFWAQPFDLIGERGMREALDAVDAHRVT